MRIRDFHSLINLIFYEEQMKNRIMWKALTKAALAQWYFLYLKKWLFKTSNYLMKQLSKMILSAFLGLHTIKIVKK